jgi:hypothetical protein
MTYRQMRLLFAGLARYDGRLSVPVARNDVPVELWTVVLRDHVRHSWLCLRRIEQLAPDEQGSGPLVPCEHPLTEFEALAQPEDATMTWLEVLWALGALEHSARGWSLVAIEAAQPVRAEPRSRLALQRAGIRYEKERPWPRTMLIPTSPRRGPLPTAGAWKYAYAPWRPAAGNASPPWRSTGPRSAWCAPAATPARPCAISTCTRCARPCSGC